MTPEPCTVRWASPVAPEDAPGLVALLDEHERDRLARFRRAADRARYLAAHALARVVLAELIDVAPAGVEFDRTCRCGEQHGKPVVQAGCPLDAVPGFSLTHAGDVVGVAVWRDGPIGLDTEHVRSMTDLAGMIRHVASPAETPHTGPATPDAFFTAWTRKEALLKATGTGLAAPMAAITLEGPRVVAWSGERAPAAPMWLRDLRPAPGYTGAVAGAGPVAPPVAELRGDHLLRAAAR
ncbi:4'-phosphopantetheinyl transferase family protein [Pseudonocardia sp.]|uniref:4'-phosphopantetheinyl transferase family protein n=1 Tax=Pseudonocardia sp. TaxID=60912 RepID=UPI003D10168F